MCKVKDTRANSQVPNPGKSSRPLLQYTVENNLSIYSKKKNGPRMSLAQINNGKFLMTTKAQIFPKD